MLLSILRCSRPEMICKKDVLQICQSLLCNDIADQFCNFIKKEATVQVVSCEFCEMFQKTFFTKHLRAIGKKWVENLLTKNGSHSLVSSI